jgi:hypothetical protein
MRIRILVSAIAFVALAGATTLVARGAASCCGGDKVCCVEHHSCCDDGACAIAGDTEHAAKQSSVVTFDHPLLVGRTLVSGPVLIVHDDARMARGEPCTTIYRFDKGQGPKEALASFHCKPRRAAAVANTVLTTQYTPTGIKRLAEYQLAGDSEAHGVPW